MRRGNRNTGNREEEFSLLSPSDGTSRYNYLPPLLFSVSAFSEAGVDALHERRPLYLQR